MTAAAAGLQESCQTFLQDILSSFVALLASVGIIMIKRLLKNKVEFSLHFCASHAHLLYYYPSSFDAPQVLPAHVITHHHYYLLLTIINHLLCDLFLETS